VTIFDKIKQGIDKGVTTASVKSRELLDASKVKSQIAESEKQKQNALTELGISVCAMLDAGHVDEEALKTARAAIAGFEQQIKDKQEELARVHAEAQQALATPPKPA
jgi:hypothetical protein